MPSLYVPEDSAKSAAPVSALDDIHLDLLRDTQEYLDNHMLNRGGGGTPSARLSNAWERFYRAYAPVIRAGVRSRLLSEADQGDCEQEAWKEVVTKLGGFQHDPRRAHLRTWLATIAHNKAVDMVRRRHRQEPLADDTALSLSDPHDDPATAYERRRRQDLARIALAELASQVSELSYRVLYLRSIEERSVAEVAAELGLTAEQVRFRSHRMKERLRRLINSEMEDRSADGPAG